MDDKSKDTSRSDEEQELASPRRTSEKVTQEKQEEQEEEEAIRSHQHPRAMDLQAQQTQYINNYHSFEPFMNGHHQGIHQSVQTNPYAHNNHGPTPFFPVPVPIQIPVASPIVQVDPILQVQYYESRMRDHAAAYAQYASAAAGAALAAAQMATAPGPFYPSNLPNPLNFFPNNTNATTITYANTNAKVINGNHNAAPGVFQQQTNNRYGMQDKKHAKKQKRSPAHPLANQQHGHGHSQSNRQSSRAPIAAYIDSSNRGIRRRRNHNSNLPSRQDHDLGNTKKRGSIKSLDFMGKTGVSALYDLCNKRHWSQPKFITNEQPRNNDSSTCTSSAYMEFIISVEVNGVLLSRGRGGSKKSAQQDAARKALKVIYPGTVFDANGILLDLGKTDKSSIVFGNVEKSRQQIQSQQGASCPLKDLEANMASRLAIHGNQSKDRVSPALSEDSSISTTVSMSKRKTSATVVTGGPFIQQKDRARNRLAFPSASTTSGISSASEDVDDDEYLASRGASVCTSLLYAMVQIGRIKEQPTYTFDVCANPATIVQQQQQEQEQENKGYTNGSVKRKGVGFSGVGGAIVSKRRSFTNAVGHVVTIHRSSFACTASLILCKEKVDFKDEYDDPKKNDARVVRSAGKDSLLKKEELLQTKGDDLQKGEDRVAGKTLAVEGNHPRRLSSDSVDDISTDTLQAVGTGATKREARHIASAKLLAKLFPECNGMVEVKAAAQTAQAQYAAKRVKLKRAAQSDGGKFAKRERRRKVKYGSSEAQENLSLVYPKPHDPTLSDWLSKYLMTNTQSESQTTRKIDSADDLAKLSLSEPLKNEQQAQPLEDDGKLQVSRQRQFEEKVDAALQILNDAEDERKPSYLKENDLSKTTLRRATIEDIGSIERLLAKEDTEKNRTAHQKRSNELSSVSPLALIGMTSRLTMENIISGIDITRAASQLWGGQSFVLILSRAIALPDEPPLGFAVLSTGFSMTKGRILRISEVSNEVHFPRERLIECLDELGAKMHCQVEASCDHFDRSGIHFTDFQLCDIIKSYTMRAKLTPMSGAPTDILIHGKPLQSVKEEEHER